MNTCPTLQQLRQWLASELEDAVSAEVDEHVNACAECQCSLEGLTAATCLDGRLVGKVPHDTAGMLDVQGTTLMEAAGPNLQARAAFLRSLEKSPPLEPHWGETTVAANPPSHHSLSHRETRLPNPLLPGYEILGILGQGGMGIVYKARQLSLKRLVGLKMLLNARDDPDNVNRFYAEAEAVAQLQHPNIVQIFEIGTNQGRPYFAMELVEGTSLARALARNLYPFHETAQLLATLAEAIHFAHERGIIHRDLKPANILLQIPECPAPAAANSSVLSAPALKNLQGAIPKVTDFGMVKRLDSDGPTVSGAVLGTPSYMPPEQAAGESALIGPATDIYGLGAILYEMLTGQPPFRGQSPTHTLWQVLHEEPTPPSQLRAHLPRDLEIICLKCLQKDSQQRYTSAAKLAEDLHAFLAGLPIQARAAGPGRRLLGWLHQHPATALFGGVGGLALAGSLVGLWLQSSLAAGALAVLSLCLGAWWYSARLERALAEVRQQNLFSQCTVERLHMLLNAIHKLLAATELDHRLRILSEATARLVNAERATIYLIDHERAELWSKVALGEEHEVIRMPLGAGIAGGVAMNGHVINLSDPYADSRFNPEVDRRTGFITRNLLTIPMTEATGRRVGVLQVLNKRGGPFAADDVEILSQLAQSAASLVHGG